MQIQNNQFLSIDQLTDQYLNQNKINRPQMTPAKASFQVILNSKSGTGLEEVKFSKHAASRLADRNITLTDSQMERLIEGTQKAEAKGINDSLVIVDQLAFIVNVPNSTVVTAMNQNETKEHIFTNIDGAVIV